GLRDAGERALGLLAKLLHLLRARRREALQRRDGLAVGRLNRWLERGRRSVVADRARRLRLDATDHVGDAGLLGVSARARGAGVGGARVAVVAVRGGEAAGRHGGRRGGGRRGRRRRAAARGRRRGRGDARRRRDGRGRGHGRRRGRARDQVVADHVE